MGARNILSENQGSIAIIVVLLMVVFLICAAMAIDVGFGLVVKNQLYNVADSAVLAGTRQLGKIYEGLTPSQQQSYVLTSADRTAITSAVTAAAGSNMAGGKSISIDPGDILIGHWNVSTRTLTVSDTCTPGGASTCPTAVEVVARRDTTANGPMSTYFAQVMGYTTLSVTSVAERQGGLWTGQEKPTAALTGVGKVPQDGLEIPVGISKQWYLNRANFCQQPIQFSPTNSPAGCAGWTTFASSPSNTPTLKSILDGIRTDTYQSPEATAGATSFNFTGGEVAAAFDNMKALFDAKKDPVTQEWTTLVVVYDYADCSNPRGAIPIVGFATVTITDVCFPNTIPCKPTTVFPATGLPPKPGDKVIMAKVQCDEVAPNTRGGGAEYGTVGSIPGLVK